MDARVRACAEINPLVRCRWFPHRFAPCFRIIREEGKYKRLRNADKFQARVSKIRKALAETSTRPVTFHEQVCLGEDDVSREEGE